MNHKRVIFMLIIIAVSLLIIACKQSNTINYKPLELIIDSCSNFNEDECLDNDNCRAIYGPSYCSKNGACTMDEIFKGCQEVSSAPLK